MNIKTKQDKVSAEFFAYQLREQGLTFKEIGKRMGVNTERARTLFCRSTYRISEDPESVHYGLSTRAANRLCNYLNIRNRKEATKAYKAGKLHPETCKVNGYGWKTYKEIAEWLGFPEPQKPARAYVLTVCPHCGGKIKQGIMRSDRVDRND